MNRGFTLIELSIVLVIIGLIVGGVLVGQDLIRAAGIRAQISQIEKYNTAAHTFQGKYGYLPGDITNTAAVQFGFTPRGPYGGQGDGNGVIEGNNNNSAGAGVGNVASGEPAMFWVDLTTANGMNLGLIDGNFSAATPTALLTLSGTILGSYYPAAKIGQTGTYIFVFSANETNYYNLAFLNYTNTSVGYGAKASLTVQQAYQIDTKMDDGLPQSGRVMSRFVTYIYNMWSQPMSSPDTTDVEGGLPFTTATTGTSSTCFDNGGVAGAIQQYSMEQNGGAGVNCTLEFQFQ